MLKKTSGSYTTGEFFSSNVEFFTIYTLVDITNSEISYIKNNSSDETKKKYYQTQNLNVLIQGITMRSQPIISSMFILDSEDLSNTKYANFGSNYTSGTHRVWILKFASDHSGAWDQIPGDMFYLKEYLNDVPIITSFDSSTIIKLDQTVTLPQSKFIVNGDDANLFFIRNEML